MTLKDKFIQLETEHPNHSSLICFYKLVQKGEVPKGKLNYYFRQFVDPMDYEKKKSVKKEILTDLKKYC